MRGPLLEGHEQDLANYVRDMKEHMSKLRTPVWIWTRRSRSTCTEGKEVNVNLPKITTLFALVKFNPVPPASVEMRKMNMSGSLLNWSIRGIPKDRVEMPTIILKLC